MFAGNGITYYRLAAIGILLFSFALRGSTLTSRSLWFDEAWEYWIVTVPFPELLATIKDFLRDPPLYSYLLYFWRQLNEQEFWLRFPSLLFSIINLLGVMSLARFAFGKPPALVASLLVAVAASDVRFAQEAGQYIFMVGFLSWSLVFLMRFVQTGAWKWAMLWAGAAVLATYTYYGSPIPVIATVTVSFVYLLVEHRWRACFVLVSASLIAALLISSLAFDVLPAQLNQPSNAIRSPAAFKSLGVELQAFLTGVQSILRFQQIGQQPAGWAWPLAPEWLIGVPGLLLLIAGAVRNRFSLPFVWLAVSIILYYLVSKSGLYHFDGRYTLILAPLIWVCLAAGAIAMWGWQRATAIVLMGMMVVFSLLAPPERSEDLRTVTQLWLAERGNHEPTYVYYGAAPGFRYQLRLAGVKDSINGIWFRDCWWRDDQISACTSDGIVYGRWIRSLAPDEKLKSIFNTLGGQPARFWIIFSHIFPNEDGSILAALDESYTIAKHLQVNNAAAVLVVRR